MHLKYVFLSIIISSKNKKGDTGHRFPKNKVILTYTKIITSCEYSKHI